MSKGPDSARAGTRQPYLVFKLEPTTLRGPLERDLGIFLSSEPIVERWAGEEFVQRLCLRRRTFCCHDLSIVFDGDPFTSYPRPYRICITPCPFHMLDPVLDVTAGWRGCASGNCARGQAIRSWLISLTPLASAGSAVRQEEPQSLGIVPGELILYLMRTIIIDARYAGARDSRPFTI